MAPEEIGRYKIKQILGRGGMATVYLAEDPYMKRQVAVKVLSHHLTIDETFRGRFRREAELIANLEHDAIVPIYDFGEHDEQPYIVMRYMPGGSLLDRQKSTPISLEDLIGIINRVARALDAAHKQGVIHRDLKPGNILFDAHGEAFLSDFGIAKIAEASAAYTASGIIGTPAYMSPEQASGSNVDSRSDIYSLGVVIFQTLTGQAPYQADTPVALAMKHIMAPIPQLSESNPDLSTGYQVAIERAMAKEPEERYQRASELADDLVAVFEGKPITPRPVKPKTDSTDSVYLTNKLPSGVTPTPPPPSKSQGTNWMPLAVVIGILLIVAVGVLIWLNNQNNADNAAVALTSPTPATATHTPVSTLTPTASATAEPTVTPTPLRVMAGSIDDETIDIYRSPNQETEVVASLDVGSNFAVLRRNAQGDWLQIQTIRGDVGWLQTSQVTILMPILDIPVVITPSPTPTEEVSPTATPTTRSATATPSLPTRTPTPTLVAPGEASAKAPAISQPPNEASFSSLDSPRLSWSQLKPTLGENELYFITILYQHGGETWTDYAWTKQTIWSVDEHTYLLDLSDNGRFVWSVKLLQKTGENEQGVPTGLDLSPASAERVFFWRTFVPDSPGSSPVR